MTIKFNNPHNSTEIVCIVLDQTGSYQSNWTRELIKNLSDHMLPNILSKGFNILQGIDEDQLLTDAADNYDYAIVVSTGTDFLNGAKFFNAVRQLVSSKTDFFLMGHVPDRHDGYYELHSQCYIINLAYYRNLNCPAIGKFEYYSSHTQIEPIRSVENIHDDYTPTWVHQGSIMVNYNHKWHGWNILSVAFDAGLPVLIFTEEFRNNKQYYYPEYQPSFLKASSYLYRKYSFASQTLFYPTNTEKLIPVTLDCPIRQLVIQASGLQFINYLVDNNYDTHTVVKFVDYNLFALECMHEIVTKWNGCNYASFVKNYAMSRSKFLSHDGLSWITTSSDTNSPDISEWPRLQKTVRFEFYHQDLVINTDLSLETIIENLPGTVIHLSHIFDYDPVSTFVPASYRKNSEKLLLNKINVCCPNAKIVMVSKVNDQKIRPTWRMNEV